MLSNVRHVCGMIIGERELLQPRASGYGFDVSPCQAIVADCLPHLVQRHWKGEYVKSLAGVNDLEIVSVSHSTREKIASHLHGFRGRVVQHLDGVLMHDHETAVGPLRCCCLWRHGACTGALFASDARQRQRERARGAPAEAAAAEGLQRPPLSVDAGLGPMQAAIPPADTAARQGKWMRDDPRPRYSPCLS